jgi:hypothetical protein
MRLPRVCITVTATLATAAALAWTVPASTAFAAVPSWHRVYTAPSEYEIQGITAPGRADAWAYGDVYNSHDAIVRPFYLHWNGQAWRAVSIAAAKGFQPEQIGSSSRANVWLFGYTGSGSTTTDAALVYNGTGWRKITAPFSAGVPDVVSATNVWVPGDYACALGACTTSVQHWNGASWQSYSVAGVVGMAIGGAHPWLAGTLAPGLHREVAYRWSGSSWQQVAPPGRSATHVVSIASPGGRVWIATQYRAGSRWRLFQRAALGWKLLTTPRAFVLRPRLGWPVYDGHTGFWEPPFHWTGTRWVNTAPGTPMRPRWINVFWYENVAPDPGTSDTWAVVLINTGNGDSVRSGIAAYGSTP